MKEEDIKKYEGDTESLPVLLAYSFMVIIGMVIVGLAFHFFC